MFLLCGGAFAVVAIYVVVPLVWWCLVVHFLWWYLVWWLYLWCGVVVFLFGSHLV